MLLRLCILFLVSCFFAPTGASAHGDSPSFEREVGDYLIDVGFDREGFRPGEEVTFNLDLYTTSDHPEFVSYDSIDIRISQENETLFKHTIQNDPVHIPSFTYTFPEAGAYQLSFAYIESGAVKVETTFDAVVEPMAGTVARTSNILIIIAAVVLVAFSVIFVIRSYRQKV
jgi:hypothetical protein